MESEWTLTQDEIWILQGAVENQINAGDIEAADIKKLEAIRTKLTERWNWWSKQTTGKNITTETRDQH